MPEYASASDFPRIIQTFIRQIDLQDRRFSNDELLVVLSTLLTIYSSDLTPDDAADKLWKLCHKISDWLIADYPFSEGYMDFLFGAAAMTRGMQH